MGPKVLIASDPHLYMILYMILRIPEVLERVLVLIFGVHFYFLSMRSGRLLNNSCFATAW